MTEAARRNDIRRAWLDEDESGLSAARVAKHRLVEQVRRLVDAAFQVDCGDAGYGEDSGPGFNSGAKTELDSKSGSNSGSNSVPSSSSGSSFGPNSSSSSNAGSNSEPVSNSGSSFDANSGSGSNSGSSSGANSGSGSNSGSSSVPGSNSVSNSSSGSTDADRAAYFLALAAEAESLADRIAALPRIPRADVGGTNSSRARRHDALLVERSTINGRGNPLSPPVRMWSDGDLIRAEAYFTAPYEGPPGRVHGAWVAACFDEVLGCAQGASGAFGFTGTLTITLRRATPLYTKITYEAGFSHREGRKIHAWGRCYADGQLTAEAAGVFIVPVFGGVGHGTA